MRTDSCVFNSAAHFVTCHSVNSISKIKSRWSLQIGFPCVSAWAVLILRCYAKINAPEQLCKRSFIERKALWEFRPLDIDCCPAVKIRIKSRSLPMWEHRTRLSFSAATVHTRYATLVSSHLNALTRKIITGW